MVKYYVYQYERTLHTINPFLSERAGKNIEQTITILDLDGLGFTKIMSKRSEIQGLLKLTSSIAQNNYPEVMGKLFVINAPMFFKMLWGFAEKFIDEKTAKKIVILGILCSDFR